MLSALEESVPELFRESARGDSSRIVAPIEVKLAK